tara:strand:- start:782 stop:1231 length:450 start_codon:yes stop_codon:yes gene_type:complete
MASWLGTPTTALALATNSATINNVTVNPVAVVANAGAVARSGTGGVFFTTGTLAAGTYLAGMTVGTSGSFISTDYVLLRIAQTAGASDTFPDQSMALVNNIAGSTGTILTNMVGMLVLSVPTTIYYEVAATTASSRTYTAEGMWYQKIA